MRPHLNLRARHAVTALGALCLAISLAVLPGTARSDDTTTAHAAIAADIAPGKSRLERARRARARPCAAACSRAPAGRHRAAAAPLRRRLDDDRPRHHARRRRASRFAFRPQQSGSARLRVARRRRAARDRAAQRLPPRRGVVVRPRPVRQQAVVRRAPDARHAGRRPQDAAVRRARDPAQGRPRDPRARRRPRPVRRRPRVRPDVRDARERLHFGGVGSLLVAS